MTNALLISLYDLGHQPYEILQLDAALVQAGIPSSIVDLSITEEAELHSYDLQETYVVISVPMHTAARLALSVLDGLSGWQNNPKIILMGHYAEALATLPIPVPIAMLASGESVDSIVDFISIGNDASLPIESNSAIIKVNSTKASSRIKLINSPLHRDKLPSLSRYTSYIDGEKMELAGYVEASRGCLHLCTHCPVAATYGGRIRINSVGSVIREIENLYESGARHITFGDPDFFNAPIHSIKTLEQSNTIFPDLTFDATIKVSHILKYRDLIPKLSENNVTFIVSAFEHTSLEVLDALEKGHNTEDMVEALRIVRENGFEIRPSLLPFTPWTTLDSMVELLDFVVDQDLIDAIDPVMYSIRLLVPSTSLTYKRFPYLFKDGRDGGLNLEWSSAITELDNLQLEISNIAENAGDANNLEIFSKIYAAVAATAGKESRDGFFSLNRNVPRLTESWYCCAEPTNSMTTAVATETSRGSCC
ncbi:MAG: radical SAM protein [Actinomycetota bacterium]|nr:radical SAM protein [Actinomycetota bacterium]